MIVFHNSYTFIHRLLDLATRLYPFVSPRPSLFCCYLIARAFSAATLAPYVTVGRRLLTYLLNQLVNQSILNKLYKQWAAVSLRYFPPHPERQRQPGRPCQTTRLLPARRSRQREGHTGGEPDPRLQIQAPIDGRPAAGGEAEGRRTGADHRQLHQGGQTAAFRTCGEAAQKGH